ncbi:SusD/RagB family nutrient-binding outer membrane lipoprotein [Maribacter sp. ACAM166]|nr:SusD/RagB family nutrient-binding outer membrane lipoprotein [Maribacter sp. ACAM166]
MKINNIIKHSLIVVCSMLLLVGCDDYLDVNDNPNNPPISTPSLTLPVAQQTFATLNGTSMVYLGQFMTYNWTTPSNWSANQNLIRYNFTNQQSTNIFETSYASIFKDLTYVQNYEDPTGASDYSAYDAIAQTIKGFQYQYLVDLYGDIPFTEANLRGANRTPKYDDAETVYKATIDSLTNAATLALNLPDGAADPDSQDIIFGGDMVSWAQFANTIKLRMLVRLSNTGQDAYIKDQISSINANGAGYIDYDVNANPGYSDDSGKQSPFWGYIGQGPGGTDIDRNDFTVATDYILELLDSYGDVRATQLYAEAANGGYKGAPQSTILPGTGFTSNDLSKVGPGLLLDFDQDQPIMILSESLFLQAEAVQRGYITGGDTAENLYNSAIEASFEYLGVEDATVAAQAYYAQAIANVSWGSSTDKIEAIITQKWIALNGTSSIEPWIELTRTGFPTNLPIPAESDGVRPVRLLYPDTEVSTNSNNVPAQTKTDVFTNNPFWK